MRNVLFVRDEVTVTSPLLSVSAVVDVELGERC